MWYHFLLYTLYQSPHTAIRGTDISSSTSKDHRGSLGNWIKIIETQNNDDSLISQPSLSSPYLFLATFVLVFLFYEDTSHWGDGCSLQTLYHSWHNVTVCVTRAAPKVVPPILWCRPRISEANVGGTAVEIELFCHYPITFRCCATGGSRGAARQNGVCCGSACEAKGMSLNSSTQEKKWQPWAFLDACWMGMEA